MSLYEPSVRSSTWSFVSNRFARPFTTLEGWREIGTGVYAMSSNIRMFSIRHQFDPEQFRLERKSRTVESDPDIPPVPAIPNVQAYGRSMRPPGSAVLTTHPSQGIIRGPGSYGLGEKRREIWDTVRPVQIQESSYHVFSHRRKWLLVIIVGVAGIFPGLTPNIYLPVLSSISRDWKVDLAAITPTISSYFVFQGIASLFYGPISDSVGRRPVYIYSLLLYIIASLVLSFSPKLPILYVFRAVQAIGIASTVTLGGAVIQDLAPESERDGFLNFYQTLRNATIVVAPILGGLLSRFLGFQAVFVFLLGLSAATLGLIALFLPETLRSIAGNGSVRLSGIHQPLVIPLGLLKPPEMRLSQAQLEAPLKLEGSALLEPLQLVKEKDILCSLTFSGIVFGIWMMVTVSTPGLFEGCFHLNDLLLGLCFVPNALGAIAGSTLMGNILNRDFLRASSNFKAAHSLPPSATISISPLPSDFPLEHTRLRRLPWILPIFIITLCGYGFTLYYPAMTQRSGWIVLPLFLQFVMAATTHAICAIHQTLVTDLWHKNGHASMAASNLVRCIVAAVGVGLVQLMIKSVGTWSSFVALSLVVMILIPLPVASWYWGLDWRAEREARWEILERVTRV